MSLIRQVCFYLTRHCNLKCRYCKIVDNKKSDELDTQGVVDALEIIAEKIKPEFLVLFGGEPFLREDIEEIVYYVNQLAFNYTIITNGTIDKRIKGLKGITCSVDWVDSPKNLQGRCDDVVKSWEGFETLKQYRRWGVQDVVGNMIIHSQNYRNVRKVVETLSLHGMWTVAGVVHSGKGWSFRSDCEELRLKPYQAKKAGQWLYQLKKKGYLVHNTSAYFKFMEMYGSSLDWKCRWQLISKYLTINSDGKLLACNDRFGERVTKMSIFDFDEAEYQRAWLKDVFDCSGCYYNHMWQLIGTERGEGLVHADIS